MKKKQIFIVDNGTYPFDTVVCIGVEVAEIEKYLKKKYDFDLSSEEKDALYMDGVGRTTQLEGGMIVLRLRDIKNDFYPNLAHEIFHSVEFLLSKVGMIHDPNKSSEAFAYQIGYLTKKIYKKL